MLPAFCFSDSSKLVQERREFFRRFYRRLAVSGKDIETGRRQVSRLSTRRETIPLVSGRSGGQAVRIAGVNPFKLNRNPKTSNLIPEGKFFRMRIQIQLTFQVVARELPYVVLQHRHGNDERQFALPILLDHVG